MKPYLLTEHFFFCSQKKLLSHHKIEKKRIKANIDKGTENA